MTSEPAVLVERDGHIVTLTLNRPDKRNAFNAEMICLLCDAWDMIDADPGIRVAVITGAGGTFSAGADLDRLVGAMLAGKPTENEYEERITKDFTLIFKGFLKEHYLRKPLVAAVEGYCYAGGFEMLMSCDLRVAAEGSAIALSEVQRGLFPMAGTSVRLPRQIGYAAAMEILLLGEPMTPAKALDIGLVNKVVPEGQALDAALDYARRLAANGPLAVQGIKRAAVECANLSEAEAYKIEMEIGMGVMASKDSREGPKAFVEKRPANFTGT